MSSQEFAPMRIVSDMDRGGNECMWLPNCLRHRWMIFVSGVAITLGVVLLSIFVTTPPLPEPPLWSISPNLQPGQQYYFTLNRSALVTVDACNVCGVIQRKVSQSTTFLMKKLCGDDDWTWMRMVLTSLDGLGASEFNVSNVLTPEMVFPTLPAPVPPKLISSAPKRAAAPQADPEPLYPLTADLASGFLKFAEHALKGFAWVTHVRHDGSQGEMSSDLDLFRRFALTTFMETKFPHVSVEKICTDLEGVLSAISDVVSDRLQHVANTALQATPNGAPIKVGDSWTRMAEALDCPMFVLDYRNPGLASLSFEFVNTTYRLLELRSKEPWVVNATQVSPKDKALPKGRKPRSATDVNWLVVSLEHKGTGEAEPGVSSNSSLTALLGEEAVKQVMLAYPTSVVTADTAIAGRFIVGAQSGVVLDGIVKTTLHLQATFTGVDKKEHKASWTSALESRMEGRVRPIPNPAK